MTVLQRVRAYVAGDAFPVVVTAIVLAIPGGYLVQNALGAPYSFGFLLVLALGVGVPRLYEYWPRTYGRPAAVAWTAGACAVMTAEMSAVYLLLSPAVGAFPAAVVAFVLADLGNTAVLAFAGDATPN